MNIEELQIGDYFRIGRDNLCITKDTIVEIRGIDPDNKFEDLIGCASCRPLDIYQYTGGIWVKYLEPIKITRDILDRTFDGEDAKIHGRNYHIEDAHGYEYEIHLSYYDGCYFSKLIEDSEYGYKDMELLLDFKYVHELQHILRIFQLPYKLKIEETD